MSRSETFTPPTIEDQYWYVSRDNIPDGRLEEMQRQIERTGAYLGEVFLHSDLGGAIEIIELEGSDGLLKIMPHVVLIPFDHPVRQKT